MKTRIEEVAKSYGDKAMGNMSPRNDDYGITHYNLIKGFIAGAEFMKQSYDTYVERDEMVKKLKAQNEIMMEALIKIECNQKNQKIINEALKKVGEV